MIEILQIQPTPNPHARRFRTNMPVAGRTGISFADAASAARHAAAQALFRVEHVSGLFLLEDSVTVTIDEKGDWEILLPEIALMLEEHLEPWSGAREALSDETLEPVPDFLELPLDKQLAHLEKVLDLKIRPGLAGDGGGLQLMGYDEQTVYIYYLGACGSCPSAGTGTLDSIRKTLQTLVHPALQVELS